MSGRRLAVLAFAVMAVAACEHTASRAPSLRLGAAPLTVHTRDVDYLRVDGTTLQATVYQPDGPGPFPAILDVHGGAWIREDVRRDEHALLAAALAARGVVVVAVDYRQSRRHHYPDSVADVNFALRWLRAHAPAFNAASRPLGVVASSSGGHLVQLNVLRPADPRYLASATPAVPARPAVPDYVILVYPISDPAARRAYALASGNDAPVRATDSYFAPSGSLEDGNPQAIVERQPPRTLPPLLVLQGSAGPNGLVADKNVSPEIQQRFAAAYRAAGGSIRLELLPGAPHNFVNAAGPHLERTLELVTAFIAQQL